MRLMSQSHSSRSIVAWESRPAGGVLGADVGDELGVGSFEHADIDDRRARWGHPRRRLVRCGRVFAEGEGEPADVDERVGAPLGGGAGVVVDVRGFHLGVERGVDDVAALGVQEPDPRTPSIVLDECRLRFS